MEFLIVPSGTGCNISPCSGMYEGQLVATADGVCLKGVKFVNKHMVGTIKALWGTTIIDESVYGDMPTLRGLAIGGRFDMSGEPLNNDFDGFVDSAGRICKTATRVTLIGGAIYAKGAQ